MLTDEGPGGDFPGRESWSLREISLPSLGPSYKLPNALTLQAQVKEARSGRESGIQVSEKTRWIILFVFSLPLRTGIAGLDLYFQYNKLLTVHSIRNPEAQKREKTMQRNYE